MSGPSFTFSYFLGIFLECVLYGERLLPSPAWHNSCANAVSTMQVFFSLSLSLPATSNGRSSQVVERSTVSWRSLLRFLGSPPLS